MSTPSWFPKWTSPKASPQQVPAEERGKNNLLASIPQRPGFVNPTSTDYPLFPTYLPPNLPGWYNGPMNPEWYETGGVYHIVERGVDRRLIFADDSDRERFLRLLNYHRIPKEIPYAEARRLRRLEIHQEKERQPLADLLCFCLMPNHFHLLMQQTVESGITRYMQRFLNSYTRYYNTRHERKGPLFEGPFRAVHVETNELLLHVSRYIHLNPVVSGLAEDAFTYPWSSAALYSHTPIPTFQVGVMIKMQPQLLQSMMPVRDYESFLRDHVSYARELEHIKHLTLAGRATI